MPTHACHENTTDLTPPEMIGSFSDVNLFTDDHLPSWY
jgi:hypothetical protein